MAIVGDVSGKGLQAAMRVSMNLESCSARSWANPTVYFTY